MARRLVEAGVRCVTIDHTNWDTHDNNFHVLKNDLLPLLDRGLSALLGDLSNRAAVRIDAGRRHGRIRTDAADQWKRRTRSLGTVIYAGPGRRRDPGRTGGGQIRCAGGKTRRQPIWSRRPGRHDVPPFGNQPRRRILYPRRPSDKNRQRRPSHERVVVAPAIYADCSA